ncbi:MAG: GDSL-type esterase/lipase family protein, partial [Oscillospiraceae bacterium]
MKAKKHFKRALVSALVSAMMLTNLSLMSFATVDQTIFEGTKDTGNWEDFLYLESTNVPDLSDSALKIEYELGDLTSYGSLTFQSAESGWPKLSNMTTSYNSMINSDGFYVFTEQSGEFTLELTDADRTAIANAGLVVTGYNLIIKSLTAVDSASIDGTDRENETSGDITSDSDVEPEGLVETIIFEGSITQENAWSIIESFRTSNSNGVFDPTEISAGGYFKVVYEGTSADQVYMAVSEWTTSSWSSVNIAKKTGQNEDGTYYSTFSYEDLFNEYSKNYNASSAKPGTCYDLSDVDAITVGTMGSGVTLKSLSWVGYPLEDEMNPTEYLFKGSASSVGTSASCAFVYTKHVGGQFDASLINEGSYFYVEYEGKEGDISLGIASHSGATSWAWVYPSSTTEISEGKYRSIFTYEDVAKKFGTNFKRLDQISVYPSETTTTILKRLAYVAGEGAPVDNTSGEWIRPKGGIAFIGDSIVHNVKNLYGDFNTILNRHDCSNYGIGGQDTTHLVNRIDDVIAGEYNKYVFLCGINDIGHGVNEVDYINNYTQMFDKILAAYPDAELFAISVLPTTPVFYSDDESKAKIVRYGELLKELCDRYENATYIDVYSSFVQEDGFCNPDYVFDGLHPNAAGYAVLAEIVNPYLGEDQHIVDDDSDSEVTGKETVLWQGEQSLGSWEDNFTCDEANIPTAEEGDKIVIESAP